MRAEGGSVPTCMCLVNECNTINYACRDVNVKEEFNESEIQYHSLDIGGITGILTSNTNETYDIKFNNAQFCVG